MKKLLLSCLFLAACSSHHNVELGPKPFALEKGMSYQEAVKGKGAEGECFIIESYKYCRWNGVTVVFQDNSLLSSLAHIEKPLNYEISVKSLKLESPGKKKVYLEPAGSKIDPDSIEWRRFLPLFQKLIKASGLQLTTKMIEADQILRVNFGIQDTVNSSKAKRFLEITAFDKMKVLKEKKNFELWRVDVTSIGGGRDLRKVLPVLAAISQYYVTSPTEVNDTRLVSENDLVVLGFKDYVEYGK